jgi:hypothetical protein
VSRPALALAIGLGTIDTILVLWAQPLFGGAWKYVMWEGGVLEDLTAVQFIAGAAVFASCAARRSFSTAHRRWFVVYALAMLVLAGEETNYGTGTLFLDLADPNFASTYNPQANNLHNVFVFGFLPIFVFGITCLILRLRFDAITRGLRLPMRTGFLDAVLVTGLFVVPMLPAFADERFLSVDEVYEWSSSLLLLCLALSFRYGWLFAERVDEAAPVGNARPPAT